MGSALAPPQWSTTDRSRRSSTARRRAQWCTFPLTRFSPIARPASGSRTRTCSSTGPQASCQSRTTAIQPCPPRTTTATIQPRASKVLQPPTKQWKWSGCSRVCICMWRPRPTCSTSSSSRRIRTRRRSPTVRPSSASLVATTPISRRASPLWHRRPSKADRAVSPRSGGRVGSRSRIGTSTGTRLPRIPPPPCRPAAHRASLLERRLSHVWRRSPRFFDACPMRAPFRCPHSSCARCEGGGGGAALV
mmetsp:Transcript_151802/g.485184  ORF Transcript_151802/g.485184 Transcript_151802/m.485184 type:complete len:248 (+) Transcript_151802:79-822(+)